MTNKKYVSQTQLLGKGIGIAGHSSVGLIS